ncbi:hypothetical protein DOM21_04960 [Bacteriovorax stolpii]|uniref:SIMPL domain-containing protein n=1 Tax=Bacteriovorax stolpii TaxID=960 RepID=UPI00115C423D|nr:SIMPL domain-containing protein [Bacteriovorax stolpii]QDK40815.1 hypothetical protein DOM21_04960 [Bacteriovorax stolpii]
MRNVFLFLAFIYSSALLADNVRLISVSGQVEKSFQPDIVRLNITVWGKGASAKNAQENNQKSFDVFKKSIETYKVKKEDVRTTTYELNPEYVYDPKTNKNNITGYTANQGLSITLRKVDEAGAFVDSLNAASKSNTGGVNVVSLGFDIDKRAEEERALLGDAVRAAEAQAENLAKAAKVKLKGVYRLSPQSGNRPIPMMDGGAAMEMVSAKRMSAPTQFMSGEVKIEGIVSVDYLIE